MALKIADKIAAGTSTSLRALPKERMGARGPAPQADIAATRLGWDGLREVHSDAHFRVLTDVALRPQTVSKLVDHVHRASAFNLAHAASVKRAELGANTRSLSRQVVNVQVLSDAKFLATTKSKAEGIVGWTLDENNFLIPSRATHHLGAESDDTISHELGHVADYRALGAFRQKVPAVFQEGVNYVLGDMYGKSVAATPAYLRSVGATIAGLSAKEARYNLDHFLVDADYDKPACDAGEFVGAAFIEYLRLHVDKDVVAKRTLVFAAVGKGQSFSAAFAAQFGVPLQKAQNDFVRFIKATENNAAARLAGTLWETGQ